MKDKLPRILAVVGAVLALFVMAVAVRFFVLAPELRPAPDVKAPSSSDAVARGKYLVNHVAACLGCHSAVDETQPGDRILAGKAGSGRDFGVWKGAPFHLRAANLTPDKTHGIGSWTDGEILRAMREGVSRRVAPSSRRCPTSRTARRSPTTTRSRSWRTCGRSRRSPTIRGRRRLTSRCRCPSDGAEAADRVAAPAAPGLGQAGEGALAPAHGVVQ